MSDLRTPKSRSLEMDAQEINQFYDEIITQVQKKRQELANEQFTKTLQ